MTIAKDFSTYKILFMFPLIYCLLSLNDVTTPHGWWGCVDSGVEILGSPEQQDSGTAGLQVPRLLAPDHPGLVQSPVETSIHEV